MWYTFRHSRISNSLGVYKQLSSLAQLSCHALQSPPTPLFWYPQSFIKVELSHLLTAIPTNWAKWAMLSHLEPLPPEFAPFGLQNQSITLHDMIQKLATTTGPQLQFPVRVLLSGILQCNRHCICTSRYCKAIKAFALGIHGQHYRGYGPEEESALPQRDFKVVRSPEEDAQLYNQMKANRHSYPPSFLIATYCHRGTQHLTGQGNPSWQRWQKDRLVTI